MELTSVLLMLGLLATVECQKNVQNYQRKCDAILANPYSVILTPIRLYKCNKNTQTTTTTTTTPATSTTTTTTTTTTTVCITPKLAKLYRMFDILSIQYLYTTSASEAEGAISQWGSVEQQSPGLVATAVNECAACGVALVPVYRLGIPFQQDLAYTASDAEKTEIKSMGYAEDVISFYCTSQQNACGASVPLHRFRNNGVYLLTTDKSEGTGTYDGIICLELRELVKVY